MTHNIQKILLWFNSCEEPEMYLTSNPNNPVVILRFATLTPERLSQLNASIRSFKLSPHPAIVPIEGAVLFELPYLMHPKYSSGFVLVRSFDPKVPSELLSSL
jgi:hypothetical protein